MPASASVILSLLCFLEGPTAHGLVDAAEGICAINQTCGDDNDCSGGCECNHWKSKYCIPKSDSRKEGPTAHGLVDAAEGICANPPLGTRGTTCGDDNDCGQFCECTNDHCEQKSDSREAHVTAAAENESVRLYFANGCFFAHQYLFIEAFERKALARRDDELTAIQGYAGSSGQAGAQEACYHNSQNYSDYGVLGYAEAVEVSVPLTALEQAFDVYFSSFTELSKGVWSRPDMFDQGPEYRSLVGVPGGLDLGDARMLKALAQAAGKKNITLQAGQGSDPDSFGYNTVYVMDSSEFHFIQAELCLQFQDDAQAKYPESYHALRGDFEKRGRLNKTGCPANYICGSKQRPAMVLI